MPENYGGAYGGYLPALSHLLGEVESPTQAGQMQQPSFGGQPGQLASFLQHPHIQQLLQSFGVNFDPSQIRQSPFFPNQFMQHHPGLGGGLSAGLANMAATPEAPEVSGAGSGLSRMAQGLMGGPELQRQYQVRQMMAPFQAAGMQMPGMEFQRKQQLLDLLTQMERDRSQMGHEQMNWQHQQPTKTPYGLLMPGGQVPPEMQGQPQHMGSQPLFNMFQGQGQQHFGSQGAPYLQPYDPNMIRQQSEAKNPLPFAKAGEQTAETQAGMAGAKVDETKSKAERNRKTGQAALDRANKTGQPRPPSATQISGQYNKAESDYKNTMMELKRRANLPPTDKNHIDANTYSQMETEALSALQLSKANTDQAQGNPGASARGQAQAGLMSPQGLGGTQGGAPPPPSRPKNVPKNYEYRQGNQGLGWYKPGVQ